MMIYIAAYLDANDTNGGTAFETAIGVQAIVIDGGTAFETAIDSKAKLSERLMYSIVHVQADLIKTRSEPTTLGEALSRAA